MCKKKHSIAFRIDTPASISHHRRIQELEKKIGRSTNHSEVIRRSERVFNEYPKVWNKFKKKVIDDFKKYPGRRV